MKTVLYSGSIHSFSAEVWSQFCAEEIRVSNGVHLCFLIDLEGSPDPSLPQGQAREIADFLARRLEGDLKGGAIIAKSDIQDGFARLIQFLLPEDAPFFVAGNENEALRWLKKFDISQEIAIPGKAA